MADTTTDQIDNDLLHSDLGSLLVAACNRTGNVTSNATESAGKYNPKLGRVEVVVQSIIFCVALVGNVFVLLLLFTGRRKLSRMTVMIVHLCCADLFVAFFNVLPQMLWDITKMWDTPSTDFHGNDFICRSVAYFQLVAMFASSYVLIATAVDRYLAICCPLSSHTWTHSKTRYLVGSAWLLSLLLALPQIGIWGYGLDPRTGKTDCCATFNPEWTMTVYLTWISLAIYALPAVILSITYCRICHTVWDSARLREQASVDTRTSSSFVTTTNTDTGVGGVSERELMRSAGDRGGEGRRESGWSSTVRSRFTRRRKSSSSVFRSNSTRRTSTNTTRRASITCITNRSHIKVLTKAKLRTVKLTIAVNVSYLICWAPYFISLLWSAYDSEAPYEGVEMTITMLLASLNSCTNPWIYLSFVGSFSWTAWSTLACCCSVCRRLCWGCVRDQASNSSSVPKRDLEALRSPSPPSNQLAGIYRREEDDEAEQQEVNAVKEEEENEDENVFELAIMNHHVTSSVKPAAASVVSPSAVAELIPSLCVPESISFSPLYVTPDQLYLTLEQQRQVFLTSEQFSLTHISTPFTNGKVFFSLDENR